MNHGRSERPGALRLFSVGVRFAFAAILTGSPARASSDSTATVSKAQADAAILDYYPSSARAAGVEGAALLQCRLNEHVRLADCTLSGESPVGYGFGEAALKMAKLSPDNPRVAEAPRSPQVLVQFTFRLNPAAIQPNTTVPFARGFVGNGPRFRERPNQSDLKFPDLARHGNTTGSVVLDCTLGLSGRIKSCLVASEQPAGFHFGQAALRFAQTFKMQPAMTDGRPEEGAHVLIPIRFESPR